MEKSDSNVGKYVSRHLSQLKILTRLVEHELDTGKGNKDVTLDRGLVENVLDTLEIFIEDCDTISGGSGSRGERQRGSGEKTVARLN